LGEREGEKSVPGMEIRERRRTKRGGLKTVQSWQGRGGGTDDERVPERLNRLTGAKREQKTFERSNCKNLKSHQERAGQNRDGN